ncbi:MAG: hypothetical protein DLM62_19350 [Pseudonocardiales bacterium]|nr:MAG: hypothetical protein DLM62_19350 [Pseudonocardiales bacterium]
MAGNAMPRPARERDLARPDLRRRRGVPAAADAAGPGWGSPAGQDAKAVLSGWFTQPAFRLL